MASNDRNQASSTTPPNSCHSKREIITKKFPCSQTVRHLFIATIGCLIYMVVAMISFYGVRNHISGTRTDSFLDAIYFTIVLMTSAGYKDLQPHRTLAILLAIFFAFMGMVLFGALMSLGAGFLLATQPKPYDQLLASVNNDPTVQYSSVMKIKWKVLAVMLAVHIFVGTPLLAFIGNMEFFRALFCVSSTITTVLSDEECFSTKGSRIFAVIWILYGMITSSSMTYIFMETYNRRRKWLVAKKDDDLLVDLQPSDLDDNGFVTFEGFLRFKGRRIQRLGREGMELKPAGLTPPKPSFKDQMQMHLKSNNLSEIIIVFVGYLSLSTVIFYVARHHISGDKTNSFLDTVYFAFVTMTSAGYGDLSPNQGPLALILASVFALLGTLLFGLVLDTALDNLAIRWDERLRRIQSHMDKNVATATSKKLIKKKGKRIAIYLLVLMVVGTAILIQIEDLDFIHALYCTSITITSSGTEKCFSTKLGRGFAIVWMIVAAIYKSYALFTVTRVYTKIKQRSILKSETAAAELKPPEKEDDRDDGGDDPKFIQVLIERANDKQV